MDSPFQIRLRDNLSGLDLDDSLQLADLSLAPEDDSFGTPGPWHPTHSSSSSLNNLRPSSSSSNHPLGLHPPSTHQTRTRAPYRPADPSLSLSQASAHSERSEPSGKRSGRSERSSPSPTPRARLVDYSGGEELEAEGGDGEGDEKREEEVGGKGKTKSKEDVKEEGAKEREERLKASLAELRKINTVMDGFLGALVAAKGHNERLEEKVRQSRALLDDYVGIMSQTHHTKQLLLNPKWTGMSDDAAAVRAAEEAREAAAARIAAEEETRLAAERAAEEERQREREREARERAAATAGRGRGRGRGGFGASGTRRSVNPATSGSSGIPRSGGTGIPTRSSSRPSSAAGGKVARYDHVQSSGYGARPR